MRTRFQYCAQVLLLQLFMLGAKAQNNQETRLMNLKDLGWFEAYIFKDSTGKTSIDKRQNYKVRYRVVKDSLEPELVKNWLNDTSAVSVSQFNQSCEEWLKAMNSRGYPAASLLSAVETQEGYVINLKLIPQPGGIFYIDSIMTQGQKFSQRFLFANMGLMGTNRRYSSLGLNQLATRLSAIEGFSYLGKEQFLINEGRHLLQLPLQTASKDFTRVLVGLSSVNNTTTGTNKLLLTGELEARFYNLFGRGLGFGMEWKKFKARSQTIDAKMTLPYIFRLPFITNFNFNLDKYDTLYTRFNRSVELKFALNRDVRLLIVNQYQDITRGYLDIEQVKQTRKLPGNANTRQVWYRAGLDWGTKNTLKVPRNNFRGTFVLGAGERKFLRDPLIDTLKFLSSSGRKWSIYDSLEAAGKLKTAQWNLTLKTEKYFPLSRLWVLKLGLDCEVLKLPGIVFAELKRYGGAKDLRGFSEQSIFANEWYMANSELRFMISNEAFIGTFINFATYMNKANSGGPAKSNAIGTGLVAAWKTQAGVVNFAWAIGKDQSQPLNLQNSKFHIGISNGF